MKPKLTWPGKFRVAFRGIYYGVIGQSSFVVHFVAILVVITLAIVLHVDLISGALLILSIGLVITAELINSAVEILFRGLPIEVQEQSWPALDIAAGAVLVASFIAVGVGSLVFVPRLLAFFS